MGWLNIRFVHPCKATLALGNPPSLLAWLLSLSWGCQPALYLGMGRCHGTASWFAQVGWHSLQVGSRLLWSCLCLAQNLLTRAMLGRDPRVVQGGDAALCGPRQLSSSFQTGMSPPPLPDLALPPLDLSCVFTFVLGSISYFICDFSRFGF